MTHDTSRAASRALRTTLRWMVLVLPAAAATGAPAGGRTPAAQDPATAAEPVAPEPVALEPVEQEAGAQQPGAGEAEAADDPWGLASLELPVRPGVHLGRLENGVRYAWLDGRHPAGSAHLVLRVAAGSLAEDDGQLGMANFVRVLGLQGTARATADEVREWLASCGVEQATSATSACDYRQTVYSFDLPRAGDDGVRRGLELLRGFADPPRCTPEALDAARARVDEVEAARAANPLETAVLESYDQLLAGTRVPERDPLGTAGSRADFDADGLRRFHRTWYRPENLTVIVVADLGGADPTGWIEGTFGDLERPALPPREPPAAGYPERIPSAYVLHRPEFDRVVLSIERLRPARSQAEARRAWREDLALQYGRRVLSLRLAQLAQRPDSPFSVAGCDTASRGLGVFEGESMSITCTKERWREALTACDVELRRALEFGFLESELERLRRIDLQVLSSAAEEAEQEPNNLLAAEILAAADGGLPPMGIAGRRAAYQPAIEALDAATCSRTFADSWTDGTLVIGSAGDLDLGQDGTLLLSAAFAKVRRIRAERPERPDAEGFAYSSDPADAVPPVERTTDDEHGFVRLGFANGVRVLLKDTGDASEGLLVSARFGAGALSIEPERSALQWVASRVLFGAGLREHSVSQLARLLAGRAVGADFAIREDFFELTGRTNDADLLLQCELLCAYLTEPGWRVESLSALRSRIPETFSSVQTSLTGPLVVGFLPAVHGDDPRFGLPAREELEAVRMEDVRAWLEPHLLSDALQVTIVGDLDVEAAEAAVARTFGALPPREGAEVVEAARRPVRMATGLRQEYVVDVEGDRALVAIFFPTTDGRHAPTRHQLSFLGRVLAERLRQEVPQRLGTTANVNADSFASTALEGSGYLQVRGAVAVDRVAEFVEACLETAAALGAEGPTEAEVARLREPILTQLASMQDNPAYWVGVLAELHNRPEALAEVRAAPGHYRRMSKADLDGLARTYLVRDRADVLVVRPRLPGEEGGPGSAGPGENGEPEANGGR